MPRFHLPVSVTYLGHRIGRSLRQLQARGMSPLAVSDYGVDAEGTTRHSGWPRASEQVGCWGVPGRSAFAKASAGRGQRFLPSATTEASAEDSGDCWIPAVRTPIFSGFRPTHGPLLIHVALLFAQQRRIARHRPRQPVRCPAGVAFPGPPPVPTRSPPGEPREEVQSNLPPLPRGRRTLADGVNDRGRGPQGGRLD